MRVEIDDLIVKTATQCEKNFACLECEEQVYCAVEQCLMHRILFVKCVQDLSCPYKGMMDRVPVCNCPVRKEIFRRYGK